MVLVAFRCQQCGECCSSMGDVIGIREKTGPSDFLIWFRITGEERRVRIDPDKHDLFAGQDIRKVRPMACPFLRERFAGSLICTVHLTRPDLCRRYACFRILVCGPGGERLGRVVDASRYFTTMDPELRALWDREIAGAGIVDEALWEEHAERVLSGAGYQVIR
ncbi:MAG: YkgJ family cysteine cluster protein [Methanoregula sp.]|nr:YkgJ family cysteine cluster protein [Methanoregula sp.]